MNRRNTIFLILPMLALVAQGCSDDTSGETDETETGTETSATGDGDGDPATTTGDGDGDPTTTTTGDGDGDGDPTGDGDGDPTGDGDGDPTGDGDGDPTGDGDGDPGELALVDIEPIGVYETGVFDEGAAEIVAFDPGTDQLFMANGATSSVDVLDLSDPTAPILLDSIDISEYGAGATSVAIYEGLLAVAVAADIVTDPGAVVFFNTADLSYVNEVSVGALPDMVTFSPDGTKAIAACEGEPDIVDPEGSIAIIDTSGDVSMISDDDVQLATFESFNLGNIDPQVRIFPGKSVAEDVEPEYIAVSADSTSAWVSLQENNALALVDLTSAEVSAIVPLGYKNHSLPGQGLDPSDDDGEIAIANWPVFGMYMPDAIARFSVDGQDYIVSANEGDARDEDDRAADLSLDPEVFPDAAELQLDVNLGRLDVSRIDGDIDNDGDYERLYAYGARSVSIWSANGSLVWDSGDQIEQTTASDYPDDFNANNDENGSFESRSDNKGPEPEGIVTAELWGKPYVFAGLERIGGIMVWDVSTPNEPNFVLYDNSTRDFAGDAELGTAGDLGPEGLIVIQAEDSPNAEPLLIVANEVSGTVRVYQLIAE